MGKSLTNQMNRAIYSHMAIGHSKRAERAGGVDTSMRIYSHGKDGEHGQLGKLKDASRQFGRWMREKHPEIRLARDIRPEHVQEFMLDTAAHSWSPVTYNNMLSTMQKLGRLTADTFSGSSASWTSGLQRQQANPSDKKRSVAFSERERALIRNDADHSSSEALKAGAFGSYYGLRVGSIASLRVGDIHPDYIHIERDKGGRSRDIYYTSMQQKQQALKALQWASEHGRASAGDKVFGIKANSIGRALQRSCRKNGISAAHVSSSSQHALRKSYARERYEQEYSKRHNGQSPYIDKSDWTERHWGDERETELVEGVHYDSEAWDVVADELGHGRGRTDLFNAYIVGTQDLV